MKFISKATAEINLKTIGMVIGDWNEIRSESGSYVDQQLLLDYKAPRDSLELYCFAGQVLKWLPKGEWWILQIDNSFSMEEDELFAFLSMMSGCGCVDVTKLSRSILFDLNSDHVFCASTERSLVNSIYILLLFEAHAYVVSSASSSGEILGIQDGFVQFISRSGAYSKCHDIIKEFEAHPRGISSITSGLFESEPKWRQ